MILATQRPGGAVNDNIRANTNLRISLRVQEAAECADVVGSPAGGRRSAASRPAGATSASAPPRCSPSRRRWSPASPSRRSRRRSRWPGSSSGPTRSPPTSPPRPRPRRPPAPRRRPPTSRSSSPPRPKRPASPGWPIPGAPGPRRCPSRSTLDELADPAQVDAAGATVGAGAPFALADDPAHQRRALFSWAPPAGNFFVCGMSGVRRHRDAGLGGRVPGPHLPALTACGSTASTSAPRPWPAWPGSPTAAGSSPLPIGSGSSGSSGSWPTNWSGAAATSPPRAR